MWGVQMRKGDSWLVALYVAYIVLAFVLLALAWVLA